MKNTLRLGIATLLVSILPGVASCATEPDAPVLNPSPKQLVRIHGRLPKSLTITLWARYITQDESCWSEKAKAGFSLGTNILPEPVEVQRVGEGFEATLVVDKYLPEQCDRRFTDLKVNVFKDENWDDPEALPRSVIEVADDHNREMPPCSDTSSSSCKDAINSDPAPVLVLCEMWSRGSRTPSLLCNGYGGGRYKQTHILQPRTPEVKVDFYDLAIDKDPLPQTQGGRTK